MGNSDLCIIINGELHLVKGHEYKLYNRMDAIIFAVERRDKEIQETVSMLNKGDTFENKEEENFDISGAYLFG